MTQSDLHKHALASLLRPIAQFLSDSTVSEIIINRPDEIYIERRGRLERVDARFSRSGLEAIVRGVLQYCGKRTSEDTRSYDARLPEGHRVHILLPPAARDGMSVTIRKHAQITLDLNELVQLQALSAEAAEFLILCVLLEKNIIISGATGSGKTTVLNCLSGVIPPHQRILVIEDSSELQLQVPHVKYLEVVPPVRYGRGAMSIRDLFRASLRMRPDRVIIGEVRGAEAFDLIQAMSSGHRGSLATLHAHHPIGALRRLETLALMADVGLPLTALRTMIIDDIDIIVQVERLSDGSRKLIEIAEVCKTEDGIYVVNEIFRLVLGRKQGTETSRPALTWTGKVVSFASELETHGLRDRISLTHHLFTI